MPVKSFVEFVKRQNQGPGQSQGQRFSQLLVTLPHSGELIPPEAAWLKALPERLLMYDVDRYVDELYEPALCRLKIPTVVAPYHRYACDLNRFASDVDESTVHGSANKRGMFTRGLHWAITTAGEPLMPAPISLETHRAIVERCFTPFHQAVHETSAVMRRALGAGGVLYHLDLHSMPSLGTQEHRDPGSWRTDLVVSNQDGKSSSAAFFRLVCDVGLAQGFTVAENWPYKGGRITEAYGRPEDGWETIQIELNRKLYMNEQTKQKSLPLFFETQHRVCRMLEMIEARVSGLQMRL